MGYIRQGMQAIKNGPKNSVKKIGNNKKSMTKGRMKKTTRRSGKRRRKWPVPKGRK